MNHKYDFQGGDITYNDEHYQALVGKDQGTSDVDDSSESLWEQIEDFLLPGGPSKEVMSNKTIRSNVSHAIIKFFADALKKLERGTVDGLGNPVPKCPELIRILTSESITSSEKDTIRNVIKTSISKALNLSGLPRTKVFISDSNRYIPGPTPSVHIGIDYEDVDVISNVKLQTSGTVRTVRGSGTLRESEDRTLRGE